MSDRRLTSLLLLMWSADEVRGRREEINNKIIKYNSSWTNNVLFGDKAHANSYDVLAYPRQVFCLEPKSTVNLPTRRAPL